MVFGKELADKDFQRIIRKSGNGREFLISLSQKFIKKNNFSQGDVIDLRTLNIKK